MTLRAVGNLSGGARSTSAVGASPATVQNTGSTRVWAIVTGGTVSLVEYSRDGSTFDTMATLTNASAFLNPGDRLRITYTVTPTVVFYPV